MRERVLLTGARCWIAIRILGYGETELLQKVSPWKDITNLSGDVLKPFDIAILGGRPPAGRPPGSKTVLSKTEHDRDIENIVDYLSR
jgi:hypothetical protein